MSGHVLPVVAVSVFLAGGFLFRFADRVTGYGERVEAGGDPADVEAVDPPRSGVLFTRVVGLLMMIGGGLASAALAVGLVG